MQCVCMLHHVAIIQDSLSYCDKESHYKRLAYRWQTALITSPYRLLRILLFIFKNTQHSIFFDSLFLLPTDR